MKRKVIIIIFLSIFFLSLSYCIFYNTVQSEDQEISSQFCVLIDAGHGGMDGGVMGRYTRNTEAPLNLSVTLKLKKCFEAAGVKVILTRKDEKGLYDEDLKHNRKRQDMQRRGEIIRNCNADVILSIHMNSYPDTVSRGGQVFFKPGCDKSLELAKNIQESFKSIDLNNKRLQKAGDFFVIKQSQAPSVLVECGFLSHPDEEQLLLSEDYQIKLAWYIYNATMSFLYTGKAE